MSSGCGPLARLYTQDCNWISPKEEMFDGRGHEELQRIPVIKIRHME